MPKSPEIPIEKSFQLHEAHVRIKQLEELQADIQAKIKRLKEWTARQPTLPGIPEATSRKKMEPPLEEYAPAFEELWKDYPARGGMKREKRAAYRMWLKMKASEHPRLKIAVFNYSRSPDASSGYARDMVRFLKEDFWPLWISPTQAMMKPREGRRMFHEQEQKTDTTSADEIVESLKREHKKR